MSDSSLSVSGVEPTKVTSKREQKLPFKGRLLHSFREFLAMFLYLWLLFALFTYHKAIVLAQQCIPYEALGIAFFNAFVLAKVMLVAEDMRLGTRFRRKAPIFPVLHKSVLFAIIFICFNLLESIVIGLWRGKTIAETIPEFWRGSFAEVVIGSLIVTVALMPFFAFRELSRVMGKGVLGALLLKGRPNDRVDDDAF